MIAKCMAHSFFADSSLFSSICVLLSHHGFCCTSPVSASLAILRIAMSTHCPCFAIACGLLTSLVLPLLFSPHTYSILWLTIAHVRSSLFWSASFHHWRLWLWFFPIFCSLVSPLVNGAFLQHHFLVVYNNVVRWRFLRHHCETLCHGVINQHHSVVHDPSAECFSFSCTQAPPRF